VQGSSCLAARMCEDTVPLQWLDSDEYGASQQLGAPLSESRPRAHKQLFTASNGSVLATGSPSVATHNDRSTPRMETSCP
jgi:hypothetical protein